MFFSINFLPIGIILNGIYKDVCYSISEIFKKAVDQGRSQGVADSTRI